MKKEDKNLIIEDLTKQIGAYNHFYLADISAMNAETSSKLRRKCFEKEVKLILVKNTLLRKALENSNKPFDKLYDALKGTTSILLSNTGNAPAKLIKEFRVKNDKPILKAAWVEESIYFGDNQLESLSNLKSKNELIADVIALLQSPAKKVILQLKTGNDKLAGIVKTLADKK